jgi:AcrR family transcriptional regulator
VYRSRAAGARAGELTRQDVIDAAAGLVAEPGYAGLTMRALARRCGVPTMTLYRHVRDKEDLLGALADRVLGELALPAAPGSLARRQAVLERLPADDFENLSRLSGMFLLRSSDRHFREGLEPITRGLESRAG